MGSRVMHYAITHEISQRLSCSNVMRLHLGGLAPDLTHPTYAPKALTHFVEIISSGKRRVHYQRFIHDYKDFMNDAFYIGYLSHLIADYIWYETMYYKYIRPLAEEDRTIAIEKGYRDFKRLNKILLRYYELPQLVDIPIIEVNNIQGLYTSYIPDIVAQLNHDIAEEPPEHWSEALEIYDLDEVLDYVNKSVTETVDSLHIYGAVRFKV